MKIWKLECDVDKYDNLYLSNEKGYTADWIQSFDGRNKRNSWKPLPVRRMEPEKQLPLSDMPGFTIPVFSEEALVALRPIIEKSVEELELLFEERKYLAINVISVLNVLDYSKSQYIKFDNSNRIMVIEKYAFKKCDDLMNCNIFKIVDEPTRAPFVSDKFKKIVEKNGFTGFEFELVWDSEEK